MRIGSESGHEKYGNLALFQRRSKGSLQRVDPIEHDLNNTLMYVADLLKLLFKEQRSVILHSPCKPI
jgi:hypothetical protein